MKAALVILSLLWATVLVIAQDSPSSDAAGNVQQHSMTTPSPQNSAVRGCLSGSAGNFTLTDQNGMQYKLLGSEAELQSKVGHEVQVSGTQVRSNETDSSNGESTTDATNSLQVTTVEDVADHCRTGAGNGTKPMNARPDKDSSPRGAPAILERPAPQITARLVFADGLMQTNAAAQQNGSKSSAMSSTTTSTSQASQSVDSAPQQPGTNPQNSGATNSQTSPSNSDKTAGSSPANNTGMTPEEANRDAQAARQGELNTNPKTGLTTGRGIDNQGVNNPAQTNPNGTPTSRNSVSPQSNGNDGNKPLYERQQTDTPDANNGNGGSAGSAPQTKPR